jgi:hypothetical protein
MLLLLGTLTLACTNGVMFRDDAVLAPPAEVGPELVDAGRVPTVQAPIVDAGPLAVTIGGQCSGLFEPQASDAGTSGLDASVVEAGVRDGGFGDAGAAGRLVLQNNGADDLVVSQNGAWAFATKTKTYLVTIKTQPAGHVCVVNGGSGIATSAVGSVQVSCTRNAYTVTAEVVGLRGRGLVLESQTGSGTEALVLVASGFQDFAAKVRFGDGYTVRVKTAPTHSTQNCTVSSASGVATGNVTVSVACVDAVFANASYPESSALVVASGQISQNATSLAFDGSKYWVGASDGTRARLVGQKLLASYSAAGAFEASFTPAGNILTLSSAGGNSAPLYAFQAHAPTKLAVKDNAGGLTEFATLSTPPSPTTPFTWSVLNQSGDALIALIAGGTVRRWKLDGSDLPSVTLAGYGTGPGEGTLYPHVVQASGYYLTAGDGGYVTAWNPAGVRVKTTRLGGFQPAWTYPASISFSYANELVWVFDGPGTPASVGTFHGYDLGL